MGQKGLGVRFLFGYDFWLGIRKFGSWVWRVDFIVTDSECGLGWTSACRSHISFVIPEHCCSAFSFFCILSFVWGFWFKE